MKTNKNPIKNVTIITKNIYNNIYDVITFIIYNKIANINNTFCIITSKNENEYFINKMLKNNIKYDIINFKNLNKRDIKKCDCIIFYELDYLLFYYKKQLNLNLIKNILQENDKKTTIVVFNNGFTEIGKNINLILNIFEYETLAYLKSKIMPINNFVASENNYNIYINLSKEQQDYILSHDKNTFINYLKILQTINNPFAFDNVYINNKFKNENFLLNVLNNSPKLKRIIFDVLNLYFKNNYINIFSLFDENGLYLIEELLAIYKIYDEKRIKFIKLNAEINRQIINENEYCLFLEPKHIYHNQLKNILKNNIIVKYYSVFNNDELNKKYNLL